MKYILILLALALTLTSSAQDVVPQEVVSQEVTPRKSIKERLVMPAHRDSLTIINETVTIAEQGDAATIIEKSLNATTNVVNGYRIVIFMSNSQTARRDAVMAQENFSALFPQEQSYLTYENPYFKVAVGNCASQEEAIILLGRLRSTFPKAFIMRESIEIGEFSK